MLEQQAAEIDRMQAEHESAMEEVRAELTEKGKELARVISENTKLSQRIERLEAKVTQQPAQTAQNRNGSSLVEKLKHQNMVVTPTPPQPAKQRLTVVKNMKIVKGEK